MGLVCQYSRKWGEEHFEAHVRKYGESTAGEQWDVQQGKDTWYEKHAHYGWDEVSNTDNQRIFVEPGTPASFSILIG
jgi:hypothetical protein